jgi:HEAT repeat protein
MVPDTPPLQSDDALRLTDFARAFKAAARAVMLYPDGHPAIAATLNRIVSATSTSALPRPMQIGVLAGGLLLDGQAPARAESALNELAVLLHSHLIAELTVYPGGDVASWRAFLLILGRSPDEVRADGGVARLLATTAGRHIELREIDYAEVLRERDGGKPAAWEQVIQSCLQCDTVTLDDEVLRELLQIAEDPDRVRELITEVEARGGGDISGMAMKTSALVRLLTSVIDSVRARAPETLPEVMRNLAGAVCQLSPDTMVSLLAQRENKGGRPDVVDTVVESMPDAAIAGFVARHADAGSASIDRVAQAFQTLVRDGDRRERLLSLAHDAVASSPFGSVDGFEEVWGQVAQKMMTSYSDKPFVSEEYANELSRTRSQIIDVEQLSDVPPELMSAWLASVATNELRRLDLTLVLDLLRLEEDTSRWATLMRPIQSLIEDLLLVGDFEAAGELIDALVREAQAGAETTRRQTAIIAIDELVAGPMMRHVVSHLATIDLAQFERVKAMLVSMGEVLIRPLAEALSSEERVVPRERLTVILLAFGAIGRREVERLKSSPNAAVRRTAIYLLREFGGSDALPELTELLDDSEPQVQREAVRAILKIGSDRAYHVLGQALAGGTERSREAIMQSLSLVRDERTAPLFAYILGTVDHRGPLRGVYQRAIEALGALKDPAGIEPLREALYRGEWWAPRRTALLRSSAATALGRIGTRAAHDVLEEARRSGSRGVRAAVRAAGDAAGPRQERRR